ncbi:hypothetical protein F4680DRAFT_222162 [Xylaria scruposa]|nr:hypothetical protein F4680DRAFT_222162 [Xylaria scruposa]
MCVCASSRYAAYGKTKGIVSQTATQRPAAVSCMCLLVAASHLGNSTRTTRLSTNAPIVPNNCTDIADDPCSETYLNVISYTACLHSNRRLGTNCFALSKTDVSMGSQTRLHCMTYRTALKRFCSQANDVRVILQLQAVDFETPRPTELV